ncbi:MAG TPA: DUF5060 domain-containing protein [Tepidisphaeraceae bacterium]|nr:DUF5060 domain-containing protein [Tepidisphaeraceae bacterium]
MSTWVEQWDIFEFSTAGPTEGNPFVDVSFGAKFSQAGRELLVAGFYDGEGIYRVRFMPPAQGEWRFETHSNCNDLAGKAGTFTVVAPTGNNRGPVRVHNTFHFQYADGTPYKQIGTTAYAWTHQGTELEELTLTALRRAPFNKIRMCVFPKRYAFNANEPPLYAFAGTAPNKWDFTRFNPEFWRHQEKRISQLRDMGIEADLILFHPYDEGHWGFDRMDAASDERYLKYCIARFGAYRNVWWSMANEFDFMKTKQPADWDRYFEIVCENDPFDHLRSIHNGRLIYDHNKPWVTHASIQNGSAVEDFGRAILYRDVYRKPVVFDEVKYEGNIPQRWGDISAEEMVHRFWQGTIAGTYVGHGETYKHPNDVIWWARGGELHGKSPPRIAFLRKLLEEGPANGLEPIDKWQDVHTVGEAGAHYLVYFGKLTPTEWEFSLPRAGLNAGMRFRAEIIDTWNMSVEAVDGTFTIIEDATYRYRSESLRKIKLPGKKWMALRITRLEGDRVTFHEGKKIYGEG